MKRPSIKVALSAVNREVSYAQKRGFKAYFTVSDLELVYHRHKGNCSICGKGLTYTKAKFMLYVPIRNGGKAEVDNLFLVCIKCKEFHTSIPRVTGRVEGYNSLADIIVSLVEAVKERKSAEEIKIIKSDLNAAISEFVQTLQYLPRKELKEKRATPIFSEENTIADLIEKSVDEPKVSEQIKDTLDTIATTRRYVILRNTIEDK